MATELAPNIKVGTMVEMRKTHPCGKDNRLFRVVYIGSRIELECSACKHRVFLDFDVFNNKLKRIIE